MLESTKYLSPEERKTYQQEIAQAGKESPEAYKIRYQRYLENFSRDPANLNKAPLPEAKWEPMARQARQNHQQGYGVEDIPLERLGIDNNNYALDRNGQPRNIVRTTYTDPKTGKIVEARPDGVSADAIVDVKSMTGKDKVYDNTTQLRAEQDLARAQGKTSGVIIVTNDPSYRPSKPLADSSVIARYDTDKEQFYVWDTDSNQGKGKWIQISDDRLLKLYKDKKVGK